MSRTWQRNFWAVWISELLAIMGFAAFMPILPYYVQYLGVPEAQVNTWAGLVAAAPAFAMGIMGPIWGALSDRHGRKMMVERAMFGGALTIALMGMVQTVEQLTVLRLIQGALTGTVAASTTLIASTTPQHRLGETLGKLQLAMFLGQSLGPLAGGLIADALGYRMVFWLTASFLLIGGALIVTLVQEDFTPVISDSAGPWLQRQRRNMGLLFTGSLLGLVLLLRFSLRVGLRMSSPLMPLLIQELLPPNTTWLGSAAGFLITISGLSSAVAAPVLGRFADRHGGRNVLFVCALVAGTGIILQALAPTYILLVFWEIFVGVAIGGTLAVISAYIGRLAPEGRAGMAYGLDAAAVSLANSLGPTAGGWLADRTSLHTTFLVGGMTALVSALGVLRLPRDNAQPIAAPAVESAQS